MKRTHLLAAIALLCPASMACGQASQPITIDGGQIDGITLAGGLNAWLGVPFAAPPVRDNRWKPPQPVQGWTGVRHADRFAPECLQPLRGSTQNHYFGEEATSEDCLYLNIWAASGARKQPVVVWIYGGGFNIGSASMANYSGEPLARKNVVRVNITYRVGPLGFLAHPGLSAESGYGGSGNYGLMDQLEALRWIRRNIAKFGGDPDNVTVVGQSAGSMSVALLQISPLGRGLFQRVAAMSGSPFGGMIGPVPLEKAEAQGLALQKELGAQSLAELRSMPGDRLITAKTARDPIVLDRHVLMGKAEEIFSARQQADVPVLLGYTRDESFGPLPPVTSTEDLKAAVTARFGSNADNIVAAYSAGGIPPARAAADIARDASLGRQMAEWANAQAQFGKAPTYAYLFARRQPYAQNIQFSDHDPATVGAYHSGDVPYWLGTKDSLNLFRTTRLWEPGDQAIEAEMSTALLNFAQNGAPASPVVGAWPAFRRSAPRLVWLDMQSRIIDWPHYSDMGLLSALSIQRPQSQRPRD